MTASFQRNARAFAAYLSSIVTQTLTRQSLVCDVIKGKAQALIRFRGEYVALGNGCTLRILQRIGPHAEDKNKVTTLEYIYAFRIGSDPQKEPLVRYEYLSELAVPEGYRYPRGHVHLSATVPDYDEFIERHEKKPLHQVHFPAGRISLEDFIELLIVEFHAPTHNSQEEALAFLRESRRGFFDERKTKD
jgi:hypothetical protein